MDYIKIINWDKYQHYKHRNPPWIKLYSYLLDDDDFDCLHDASKLLFFCLLLFASRRNNKIKLNYRWLQKKLPIEQDISMSLLQPLINNGFITVYQDASKMQADCKQNAIPEKSRVEKSRVEKSRYLEFVFLTNKEHKKLIESMGEKETNDYIERLNNYIGSKGKKYKSHYHTILNWKKRDEKNANGNGNQKTGSSKQGYAGKDNTTGHVGRQDKQSSEWSIR